MAYFHWYFLAQPFDLPERMIGADPEGWVRQAVGAWSRVGGAFDDEAVAEYVRCFADPEASARAATTTGPAPGSTSSTTTRRSLRVRG